MCDHIICQVYYTTVDINQCTFSHTKEFNLPHFREVSLHSAQRTIIKRRKTSGFEFIIAIIIKLIPIHST